MASDEIVAAEGKLLENDRYTWTSLEDRFYGDASVTDAEKPCKMVADGADMLSCYGSGRNEIVYNIMSCCE